MAPPGEATNGENGTNSYSISSSTDAEKLLQEEIMKLSLQERNDYQEEIHGVRIVAKEETPELLAKSLKELDATLNSKSAPPLTNFLKSQQRLPTYVNTEAFRLRFLRCALFDVSAAAQQINNYLGVASELFGEIAFQRPIRMSDFSKTELREFRKGRFQFLPYRDRAGKSGRRILAVICGEDWGTVSAGMVPAKVLRKIRFYMLYVAGEEIEAQKSGIVIIVWFDRSLNTLPVDNSMLLPMGTRISSIHVCTPDTPKYRWRRAHLIKRFTGTERTRTRIHLGTIFVCWNSFPSPKPFLEHITNMALFLLTETGQSMELMYTLQSFGIPVDYIPISFTGKVKDKYIKEWIRLRQLIEDERLTRHWTPESKNKMIESPYSDDILFRNGTSLLSHPGNSSLRTMVADKIIDDNEKNTKDITNEIIAALKGRDTGENNDRRFLIWDEKGWWKEIPTDKNEEEIHKKIARIVRDTRKVLLANPKTKDDETPQANGYMFVDRDASGSEKRQRMCFGPDGCSSNAFCRNP